MEHFNWIPLFKEISDRLVSFEDRQSELVKIIAEATGSELLNDRLPDGRMVPLTVMDPFSFFTCFLKYGNERIRESFQRLKDIWGLTTQVDHEFLGVPRVNPRRTWFFAYADSRGADDISILWELFHATRNQSIDDDIYTRALNIKNVGPSKITEGVFWIDPENHLPINKPVKASLSKKGMSYDTSSWPSYKETLIKIRQELQIPLHEFSHEAYLEINDEAIPEASMPEELPTLSTSEWLDVLKNKSLIRDSDLLILAAYLASPNHTNNGYKVDAWLRQVPENKSSTAGINSAIGYAAKRILKQLPDAPDLPTRRSGKPVYWRLFFTGDYTEDGLFPWTLRPELVAALRQIDLPDLPDTKPKVIQPSAMPDAPLNQILHGPPGTGKTYRTIAEAVAIVNPSFKPTNGNDWVRRKSLTDEYRRLKDQGLIVFTTFHQSLSYEDFVEGIKPTTRGEGEKTTIGYDIKLGIFQELSEKAQGRFELETEKDNPVTALGLQNVDIDKATIYKFSLGDATKEEDKVIFEYGMTNDWIALGYGGDVDYGEAETPKAIKDLLVETTGETTGLQAITYLRNKLKEGDVVLISRGLSHIQAVGIIDGPYEFNDEAPIRYQHFRKVRWLRKNINYPILPLYGKQLSQSTVYAFNQTDIKKKLRANERGPLNHVLIIDEINRGNVSRIFGELITLLEADKRLGQPEALTVTLPYSREKFGIPPNLHLIGTMNTADRSVEALDSALRRRFHFLEMPSRPELFNDKVIETVNLGQLLSVINRRIGALLDEDHYLGHTYFYGVETLADLKRVFERQFIPQLREYFYGNNARLRLVIGAGFFDADADTVAFAPSTEDDDLVQIPETGVRYVLKTALSDDDFRRALQQLGA